MLAFLLGIHVLIVDPAIAVAADLVAVGDHLADRFGMTLGGHGHGEDGQRQVVLPEQLEQAPYAGATTVFVERFHAHVAHALQRLGGYHFREERFGFLVAVQDAALTAFLIVEDEGEGDAGVARPVRMGWVVAVSDQVAGVVCAHSGIPCSGWRPALGRWAECAAVMGLLYTM
ncbi:hypothetical protein D9M71_421290 [compost metagenome]